MKNRSRNQRKSRLAKNTITSLVLQLCTIISGFVIPRLILVHYGSEVNGLLNSITQFLQIIAFLELGVGAVVQSSLYDPLANRNITKINQIITSAERFFKKIGIILLAYVFILIVFYPIIANQNFDFLFTAALIVAVSITYFSQYYFGIVDQLLLTADQRGYVFYLAQTIVIIVNTVACAILILAGGSIQLVKMVTSLILLIRPLVIRIYVNKRYGVNRREKYKTEPISQKWNGIAQHISAVVLDNTDTIVLTIMSTMSNVSIYSVYHLVVFGVKTLFTSLTNGIQALLGELWAKRDERLTSTFNLTEWIIHSGVVIVFGCTAVLIMPFVSVYTYGVNDTNYIQPLFAILIVSAHALHCLRLPYHIMIKASGKYKETQNNYIIAAVMNLVISIVTVKMYGLIGVAIGTLISMLYQTIWMASYTSKNLIKGSFSKFIKQFLVDIVSLVILLISTKWIYGVNFNSYFMWALYALIVFILTLVEVGLINIFVYKSYCKSVFNMFFKKFIKIEYVIANTHTK